MQNEKPVQTFRRGAIGGSVWLRRGRNGVFYEFSLSRCYPLGEEEFGYTNSFRQKDADDIASVALSAADWIRLTMDNAETVMLGHDAA